MPICFANVLDGRFDVDRPDQAYVGDFIYFWTQESWLYLAVVIDLYSRKVVGLSMGSRMKAQLVCVCGRCDRLTGLLIYTDHHDRKTLTNRLLKMTKSGLSKALIMAHQKNRGLQEPPVSAEYYHLTTDT